VRHSLLDFRYGLYVYLSSGDVYPDCSTPRATREESNLVGTAVSDYGFHKRLAEQCVSHGAHEWLIVRCGGFVGPGLRKNAIYDILHGGPLWLDPASELQFLHTLDHARLVFTLAQSAPRNQVYNLSGQGVICLEDVIQAAGEHVAVERGSLRLRYELSLEKASQWVRIPQTRETVLPFVRSEVERQIGAPRH
jgi:nucleoside-diphosphate-sugar epimerase